MRSYTDFNDGWVFHEGSAGALTTALAPGKTVRLPHNAVELPFSYFDERSYQRAFTYQKVIAADPAWADRDVTLVFDGAMANAIEAGDGKTALRQLALMLDAGAAPEQIMGQLGWLVRTKFPYQVPAMLRPAVQALFRTDLDLKRSAGEPRVLLERLVVELCARGAGRPSQTGGARRY